MTEQFKNSKYALIVKLYGEVDQYAAAEIKGKIDIEIMSSSRRNLIFDLSEVTFMDSSGIGLIVGRYKVVHSLGGCVMLCGASPTVRKMIELSGISKIVQYYNTVHDAEKEIKAIDKREREGIE